MADISVNIKGLNELLKRVENKSVALKEEVDNEVKFPHPVNNNLCDNQYCDQDFFHVYSFNCFPTLTGSIAFTLYELSS